MVHDHEVNITKLKPLLLPFGLLAPLETLSVDLRCLLPTEIGGNPSLFPTKNLVCPGGVRISGTISCFTSGMGADRHGVNRQGRPGCMVVKLRMHDPLIAADEDCSRDRFQTAYIS